MIAIGNNKLKKRYITDSNGNEQEAKKVYIGTNLVHLHMQDSNNPFAYRITNDGKIGEAVGVKGEISNIKGNTVSWNQLYNTEVPTAISGNSYYLRENINSIISKRISTVVSYTEGSTERNCCDLTLIYGAGNEPTTAAQFEADYERWFGKLLTYEDYNAGELIPVKTTAIKTIGFNQFNPTTNIAKVIKGIEYQITGSYTSLTLNGETIVPDSNGKFTPSITGEIQIVGGDSSTTCVHLSGRKDGEYESYEEHTLQLPITTLTGKLNGEGESVIVFPDGMKKAGSVQDEIYVSGSKTYAVKRVGSVDLGSLNWEVSQVPAGYFRFSVPISNMYSKNFTPNILSAYGFYGSHNPISPAYVEKGMAYYRGAIYTYVAAYTTIESFKAAMQGVMLYYELAEPIVYELDDFELPENYIANGLGTEELLPANDTALVTAPADMTIDYTLN